MRGSMISRRRGHIVTGLGSLAAGVYLVRRLVARPKPAGDGMSAGTNWSPVSRAEPDLREARRML